jgi:hypothetical protein
MLRDGHSLPVKGCVRPRSASTDLLAVHRQGILPSPGRTKPASVEPDQAHNDNPADDCSLVHGRSRKDNMRLPSPSWRERLMALADHEGMNCI